MTPTAAMRMRPRLTRSSSTDLPARVHAAPPLTSDGRRRFLPMRTTSPGWAASSAGGSRSRAVPSVVGDLVCDDDGDGDLLVREETVAGHLAERRQMRGVDRLRPVAASDGSGVDDVGERRAVGLVTSTRTGVPRSAAMSSSTCSRSSRCKCAVGRVGLGSR